MDEAPKHILSKSTFMYGCQCPKRLWLYKFHPELRDELDEQQATIFQRGTDVGLLAQQLFPGGVNAAPPTPFEYQKSVLDTAKYICDGHKIIYEAAFQHDGILCAIDILVNRNDRWFAYEIKSTASVKPQFMKDAALQFYVMTQSGLSVEDIFITHLNTKYIRHGQLDMNQLFTSVSVKKEVMELQPFVDMKANDLKNVLQLQAAPVMEMGDHCYKPYACDFQGFCSMGIVESDVEDEYVNHHAIVEFL